MGRNSESGDSKFVVGKKAYKGVLEEFEFVPDESLDLEANVKQCFADLDMRFEKRDGRNRLVFRVDDDHHDHDYDEEWLIRLAPFVGAGSYYESIGDGVTRYEYRKGKIFYKGFEIEWDEETGEEASRTLIGEGEVHRYGEGDEDDAPRLKDVRLVDAQFVIRADRLADLLENLPRTAKRTGDARTDALAEVEAEGWLFQSESDGLLRFGMDADAFRKVANRQIAELETSLMPHQIYGRLLVPGESFVEFDYTRHGETERFRDTIEYSERERRNGFRRRPDEFGDDFLYPCKDVRISPAGDPLCVDLSHWLLDDPKWVKKRERSWKRVEKLLGNYKTKKCLNVVKAYFMKGKMPDWQKLYEQLRFTNPYQSHLDLFSLLYCHPVQEYEVLKPLADAWMAGETWGRTPSEVRATNRILYDVLLFQPATNGGTRAAQRMFPFDGDAELYVNLLYAELPENRNLNRNYAALFDGGPGYSYVRLACQSLLVADKLTATGERFALQFQPALELLHARSTVSPNTLDDGARFRPEDFAVMRAFDVKREGDTVRSRFVRRFSKMLETHDWPEDFVADWKTAGSG
ncbi:MAG: hypothetical protein QNJ00_13910 [Woeseiaceae bacterium]|nr:hypothetical protein [Woeseiaceae bacterium]